MKIYEIFCLRDSQVLKNFLYEKPWLRPTALAFPKPRPGQKPSQAKVLAWLGPAFFGSAWPGLWPQAGAGTSLATSQISRRAHLIESIELPNIELPLDLRTT